MLGSSLAIMGVPVYALGPAVTFISEDTTTGGNWVGTYGTCGHVLPGPRQGETGVGEVSIGGISYSNDINQFFLNLFPYGYPIELSSDQQTGMPYYAPGAPYHDEYVNPNNCFTYNIAGESGFVNGLGTIYYPAFVWAWDVWHTGQTQPREVVYTTNQVDDGQPSVPAWRLAAWDSGGERTFPKPDYFNFTLTFTKIGTFTVELYAYDFEGVRAGETFNIYDSTGTQLLATKSISGATFTNGVYETFATTITAAPTSLIITVMNNGAPANSVLSGVFLECNLGTACGLTPGFWKTNAGKDLGLLAGDGIQVPLATYLGYLQTLATSYPTLMAGLGITGGNTLSLQNAYTILGGNNPAATAAKKNLLTFLLDTVGVPNYGSGFYNGHPINPYWINYMITEFNAGHWTNVNSLGTILNNDTMCLPLVG